MVGPITNSTVAKATDEISKAHDAWAEAARTTLRSLAEKAAERWGIQSKREPVKSPNATLGGDQPLSEILNQCATMERLLDALRWATTELPHYNEVRVAHPTTSSRKRRKSANASSDNSTDSAETEPLEPDNDLILATEDGHLAIFEVSDVASKSGDGNHKEEKDLKSLGVSEQSASDATRRFLVVSAGFGQRLKHRGPRVSGWKYEALLQADVDDTSCTWIIEVQRIQESLVAHSR